MCKYLIKFLFFVFLILPLNVFAGGITKFDKFMTANYWVENNSYGDNLILNEEQIANLNSKICKVSHTVFDIATFPQKINGEYVKAKVSNFTVFDDILYLNGKAINDEYKDSLKIQANINNINKVVIPQYAVAIRRSYLRNQPTIDSLYYDAGDTNFDALQDTTLEPCEPVVIMHTSKDKLFYYVQAGNYCGWVSKQDLALTNRKKWLEYANPSNFLIITKDKYICDVLDEKVIYQLGAKIPFIKKDDNGYIVSLPTKDEFDNLTIIEKNLPFTDIFHERYLPYTSNNILKLAMEFNGKDYGWGGLNNSVDCSGLLYCVYRGMGIFLPRNADEQEATYGKHISFSELDNEIRLQAIRQLTPGVPLFIDGHCMIYLGKSNDVPYVIHALGSYNLNGKMQKILKVVISDLSLQRSNGKSFLEELTQAVEYK